MSHLNAHGSKLGENWSQFSDVGIRKNCVNHIRPESQINWTLIYGSIRAVKRIHYIMRALVVDKALIENCSWPCNEGDGQ